MNKENIPVITDREKLYDKCENMEQLFDKYYLPLLDKHYSKIYELQQEIKLLKIQVSSREEVIDKTINAIDLVIELIKQQPTKDDRWILDRLNGFKIILEDKEVSE